MTTVFSSWSRVIFLGALVAATLLGTQSHLKAASLYYWDTNGSEAGPGANLDGTWGEDPNWTTVREGTGATQGWPESNHAVFAAQPNTPVAFTVTVSGTQFVGDMHFDYGTPTLQGGTLGLDNGNRLISAFSGVTATVNTPLANKNPGAVTRVTKYKPGTLILGGANTYSGETMIEGGILQLGAADRIPDSSNLILGNGDTRAGDGFTDTPATFYTAGFSETLGTLRLTGPNPSVARTLDFGAGASALVFADSSAADWEGIPLTIVNYTHGVDTLRFGTSSSGLTSTQLGQIVFADFGVPAVIDAQGFVSPAGPRITSVTGIGTSNTVITWTAVDGRTYKLQYKLDLGAPTWTDVAPDVFAFGSTASTTDNTSSGTARYYRVIMLP